MLQLILGIGGMLGGLTLMRLSLSRLFRYRLTACLTRLADSPCIGFLLGIICAALLQGSTAVSLLTLGLVSGGILSFPQSIAILLGANVGTCSTVPLLLSVPSDTLTALNPYIALLLLPALLHRHIRPLIGAVGGLCLMLAGFHAIRDASSILLRQDCLIAIIDSADSSLCLSVACGTLLTFLLQSASSSTLLLTTLYEEGLLAPHTVCYLVYGNNIGSCLSSVLVSTAAPHEAKMTALANLLLNLGGTLLFLPLTDLLISLALSTAPTPAEQLVFYHTTFNLITALLLLPFTHQYATLIEHICTRKKG